MFRGVTLERSRFIVSPDSFTGRGKESGPLTYNVLFSAPPGFFLGGGGGGGGGDEGMRKLRNNFNGYIRGFTRGSWQC